MWCYKLWWLVALSVGCWCEPHISSESDTYSTVFSRGAYTLRDIVLWLTRKFSALVLRGIFCGRYVSMAVCCRMQYVSVQLTGCLYAVLHILRSFFDFQSCPVLVLVHLPCVARLQVMPCGEKLTARRDHPVYNDVFNQVLPQLQSCKPVYLPPATDGWLQSDVKPLGFQLPYRSLSVLNLPRQIRKVRKFKEGDGKVREWRKSVSRGELVDASAVSLQTMTRHRLINCKVDVCVYILLLIANSGLEKSGNSVECDADDGFAHSWHVVLYTQSTSQVADLLAHVHTPRASSVLLLVFCSTDCVYLQCWNVVGSLSIAIANHSFRQQLQVVTQCSSVWLYFITGSAENLHL